MAELSWRTHPFRQQPGRGLAALAVVLMTLVLVQSWARTPLLTALGAVLFLVALWPFYFPVHYRLNDHGIRISYGLWRRRWPWERFTAFQPVSGGMILTPFRWPSRLERFRSVMLPCPGNAEQVRQRLSTHLICRAESSGKDG